MDWIIRIRQFGLTRIVTHLFLFGVTILVTLWTSGVYVPNADWFYVLTIACGYVSLVLVGVTLIIGPLKLLWQPRTRRRLPVNFNLRRDVGIWAGVTGCVHVVCGFQVHFRGNLLAYFFAYPEDGRVYPLTNLFGLSNYVGLAATIVLILLLVTSNDWSLKRLKGKRWKQLQRLNYLLVVLVLFHTLAYQQISARERAFIASTVVLAVTVVVAQAAGYALYRRRNNLKQRTHMRLS